MEIIVQGYKIDTKDIWAINDLSTGRQAGFEVCLVGGNTIKVTQPIPYERTPMQIHSEQAPYDRLREEIQAKWEADKNDIPVFKV